MSLENVEEKRKEIAEWKELLRNSRFQQLRSICEGQVRLRKQGVFNTTVNSLDAAFGLASEQGEIRGIQLFAVLADQFLLDAETDLKGLLEEEREG